MLLVFPQVFMIQSMRTRCKEVAAIIPAKNLTAEELAKMTMEVLRVLHKTGFNVRILIADNNYINGNSFKIMTGE